MWYGTRKFGGVRGWRARIHGLIALGLLACGGLFGQALPYFATAEGLAGAELEIKLRQITSTGHVRVVYTDTSNVKTDVWDVMMDMYEDPENPDNIILFYSQASIPKALRDTGTSPNDYWNREHLWPRSYGIGSTSSFDFCDLFHLVPAYKGVNSARGNKYFDYSDPDGPGYAFPAHPLAPTNSTNTATWEPADGQKGWVARSMLYMPTRYSFLSLVDTPPHPAPSSTQSVMAQLSTMLIWNRRFPPGEKERFVNQRVYTTYQYNRNPFIDFPEFADVIWLAGQPSWGGWRLRHFTLEELLDPEISGDFADPDGDGLPNLVEMALYSDPRTPNTVPVIEKTVNEDSVTVSFTRASTLEHLNLVMKLQRSADLETWTTVPLDGATVTPLDAERESVTVTHSLAGPEPQFFRIQVARP